MTKCMSTFAVILRLTAFVSLTPFVLGQPRTIQLVNNCSYTIWPASSTISINFSLSKHESHFINVPPFSEWRTKIWGRTGCQTIGAGKFECKTGYCGSQDINCSGNYFPTTFVEFRLHFIGEMDYYDISLVDGYNLPVMVAPQMSGCEATGCIFDVDASCAAPLKNDSVCASPCSVFKTDEYCCAGGNITTCVPNNYSRVFKKACPRAYCYAYDDAYHAFSCQGSPNYTITFCPSPQVMARAFSQNSQAPSSSPSPILPPTLSPTSPTKERKKHHPPPTSLAKESKRHQQTYLLVAILVATLFLVFLGLCIFMHRRRARRRYINAQLEDIKSVDSLQFDLNKIKAATHNFSVENKLGEGGFGEVYKGILENGQEIAVKRLSKTSGQGVAEFKTEVVLVAKLQHKNLVKLLGFCVGSEEKILVYEYLPNSSLDKFIFDPNMSATLDWQTRLKIIIGFARGLLYLHEDSRLKVIHRDLKTSNILLDQDMNPKISDFGLARLFGVDQTQGATNRIVGTYGYMAPEYAITGHYSVKSDVYSFGVIMLEIVSGQKSRFLACLQLDEEALLHRAWRLWNEGRPLELVDRAMNKNFSTEEVMKCINIGMLCIQEDAAQRPRMTSIVAALSGHSINLPMPKPPHFFGNSNVNGIGNDRGTDENDNLPWVYSGTNTITHLYPRE